MAAVHTMPSLQSNRSSWMELPQSGAVRYHSQRVTTSSFQQNSHCMPRSYFNLDTIIQSHYPLNYLESNFSLNNYNTVGPNHPPPPPKEAIRAWQFQSIQNNFVSFNFCLTKFGLKIRKWFIGLHQMSNYDVTFADVIDK